MNLIQQILNVHTHLSLYSETSYICMKQLHNTSLHELYSRIQ